MAGVGSPFHSLQSIIEAEGTNGWKAERCLHRVAELPFDDLAKPELLAAAQTFSLLAVADALYESGTSRASRTR